VSEQEWWSYGARGGDDLDGVRHGNLVQHAIHRLVAQKHHGTVRMN
jgi:hypothetical protein